MKATKHGSVSARVIEWDPNVWRTTCKCRATWTAPTYEAAEDEWRRHVWILQGNAPQPMGDKADRWMPEATS